jgi:hypothetical protein
MTAVKYRHTCKREREINSKIHSEISTDGIYLLTHMHTNVILASK